LVELIYKLFGTILEERIRLGDLVRAPVAFDQDESEKRELFMPPALRQTLSQVHPKMARDYAANIRAFLGRFVKGQMIDNENYMKSWANDVFELRVQNQKRGDRVRIFGAFGRPDSFVAFFRRPRSYFGGKDDPRWDDAVHRVAHEWNVTFPGCPRVPAHPFSNCVTFNFVDVRDGG